MSIYINKTVKTATLNNGMFRNEFELNRHMSGAKRRKKICIVPSTFLALYVRFGERFRDG